MTDVPVAVPPSQINIADYVDKYVRLRDKIAEVKERHKDELKVLTEPLELLGGFLLAQLDKSNVESMRTDGGTISKTEKPSATIEDMAAFRKFVEEFGEWDLVDWRANAPAVKEYAVENSQLPPGVKYSAIVKVSVRRPSKT
jgi:hypothetical protein